MRSAVQNIVDLVCTREEDVYPFLENSFPDEIRAHHVRAAGAANADLANLPQKLREELEFARAFFKDFKDLTNSMILQKRSNHKNISGVLIYLVKSKFSKKITQKELFKIPIEKFLDSFCLSKSSFNHKNLSGALIYLVKFKFEK